MKFAVVNPLKLRPLRPFHIGSRTSDVLADPRAAAIFQEAFPQIAAMAKHLGPHASMSLGQFMHYAGIPTSAAAQFWEDMKEVSAGASEPPRLAPSFEYEDDGVQRASAIVDAPATGLQNECFEVRLSGPSHGNPFVDVELSATFTLGDESVEVGGFYDGNGQYIIRFLPRMPGSWIWSIESTSRSLDGLVGVVEIAASLLPGVVQVTDEFHFGFQDGTPYIPFGTTAYAWTHQGDELEKTTLRTLADSPFTKIRMCVFPKSYDFNQNEPKYYAFEKDGEEWDYTRFNPVFFHHLEKRILQLNELGIQADLILFHPYDRWGFAEMGEAADDRYVRYIVRRLAAFPNIWWSLANEWDFVWAKDAFDWERVGRIVTEEDHAGHLRSIHNGTTLYENDQDWITHASIQGIGLFDAESVGTMRSRLKKPVVVDEAGYEGNVEQQWGNLTAIEEVHRAWSTTICGGYFTHGETYVNDRDELWWAKGGKLVGESPTRIAFLRQIIQESPTGRLDPIRIGAAQHGAGVSGEYEIYYIGNRQPGAITLNLPADANASIDVIDTWNMTIETVTESASSPTRIDLPVRPWLAVRVRY